MDREVENVLPGIHQGKWQSLVSYRSSLQENEILGKRNRGRKRNREDEDEELTLNFLENS